MSLKGYSYKDAVGAFFRPSRQGCFIKDLILTSILIFLKWYNIIHVVKIWKHNTIKYLLNLRTQAYFSVWWYPIKCWMWSHILYVIFKNMEWWLNSDFRFEFRGPNSDETWTIFWGVANKKFFFPSFFLFSLFFAQGNTNSLRIKTVHSTILFWVIWIVSWVLKISGGFSCLDLQRYESDTSDINTK